MISPYERRRRQLAEREYRRVNNVTYINDPSAFHNWFLTVFLVDAVYQEMVNEEIGTEENYTETPETMEPTNESTESYSESSSDSSSESYDSGSSDSFDSGADFGGGSE